eukprot:g316.t1
MEKEKKRREFESKYLDQHVRNIAKPLYARPRDVHESYDGFALSGVERSELRERRQGKSGVTRRASAALGAKGLNSKRKVTISDIKLLLSHTPHHGKPVDADTEKELPKFCFPESETELQSLWKKSSESDMFCFVLTKDTGARYYGFCMRILPLGPGNRHDFGARFPECLCLVSGHAHFELFAATLSLLAFGRWRNERALKAAVNSLNSPEPPRAGRIFNYFRHIFYRPAADERGKPPLARLLSSVTLEDLLRLVSAALCERRIIIVSRRMQVASECVHALASLLYPFTWQNIFLPVVPQHLIHVVMSPTPFIAGMRAIQLQMLRDEQLPLGELVLLNADTGDLSVEGEYSNPITPIGEPEVAKTGTLRFTRAKHGEFGCLRLRRELQGIYFQGKGLAAMMERGEGSSQLPEFFARSDIVKRGLQLADAIESRQKKGADSVASWDDHSVRVAFLSFFLRILTPIEKYIKPSTGRQRNKVELDVDAFASSQPDEFVTRLLLNMRDSLLLEHFAYSEAAATGKCTPRGGLKRSGISSQRDKKSSSGVTDIFGGAEENDEFDFGDDNANRDQLLLEAEKQRFWLKDYLCAKAAYHRSLSWTETKKCVNAVLAVSERRRRQAHRKEYEEDQLLEQSLDAQEEARQRQDNTLREIVEECLMLTSNSVIGAKRGESAVERKRSMLLHCRHATYSEVLHPALWRVLDDRLDDSSGAHWRHASKALNVIDFLLRRGSPRVVSDVLGRMHIITKLMLNHENTQVRKNAQKLYALCNVHQKLEWARHGTSEKEKSTPARRLNTLYGRSIFVADFNMFHRAIGRTFGNRIKPSQFRREEELLVDYEDEGEEEEKSDDTDDEKKNDNYKKYENGVEKDESMVSNEKKQMIRAAAAASSQRRSVAAKNGVEKEQYVSDTNTNESSDELTASSSEYESDSSIEEDNRKTDSRRFSQFVPETKLEAVRALGAKLAAKRAANNGSGTDLLDLDFDDNGKEQNNDAEKQSHQSRELDDILGL